MKPVRLNHNCSTLFNAVAIALSLSLVSVGSVSADSGAGITFHDIAAGDGAGITYRRAGSPSRDAIFEAIRTQPVFTFFDVPRTPEKARGAPGVAIFDYDGDGDLDLYVSNGPGVANSLYSSQLTEDGELHFVDVAVQAGVAATDMDSNSLCYGDIDNDGDQDLYVTGAGEPNRLFENQGDGTFRDITASSSAGAGNQYPAGCSMGDVNGDGLLDIVVANNSATWDHRLSVFQPFGHNAPNQLFINAGGNTFIDASATSGVQTLVGLPPGESGRTWASAMVDYDLDGDIDILFGDDQGAIPDAASGGVDRGIIHLLQNDGTGQFTDVSIEAGTNHPGAWMGFAFADFNADGYMDMFGTNGGDYTLQLFPLPMELGAAASRWFLGQADGSFSSPGVGDLVSTVFGWGVIAEDYDNDGDADIMYYGGLDTGPYIDKSNPGVVLRNDGLANFSYDLEALAGSTNHSRRNPQGVAAGDLNNDGFIDVVTVSNVDIPESFPLSMYPIPFGSVMDATAFYFPSFTPSGPGEFVDSGLRAVDGTITVEVNSADNGNNWASVDLMGTVGITSGGKVNRDGIGAVLSFLPRGGEKAMYPVVGGASYGSQDSLTVNLGMGHARKGLVEILWPGGVRNRFYGLHASERMTLPEIPCSFDADWDSRHDYRRCVRTALGELYHAGKLDRKLRARLFTSAMRAYHDARENDDGVSSDDSRHHGRKPTRRHR
ncbi:MAG TPA: CRTAC1 family protein [Gammaproteobacteria bacterium]|nr:CRTAC1 family protein [Gammaproteobacteria bacterium]